MYPQHLVCVYVCACMCVCMCVLVAQSCATVCNPVDCSFPGSSVHGILQARVLEWVAFPFSKGSSQPWDWTQIPSIAARFFTIWATREASSAISLPTHFTLAHLHSRASHQVHDRNPGKVQYTEKRWICNAFVANKLSSWKCNLPPYWPVLLKWLSTFPWHLITVYNRKKIRSFNNNVNVTINKDKSYIRASLHIFHRTGKF